MKAVAQIKKHLAFVIPLYYLAFLRSDNAEASSGIGAFFGIADNPAFGGLYRKADVAGVRSLLRVIPVNKALAQ